jgi:hypothetical protein
MTLPLCAVTCIVNEQDGDAYPGGTITAQLSETDHYDGLFVVPQQQSATIDATGTAVLNLWPNVLGTVGTVYKVKITLLGGKTIRGTAIVPNAATAFLHEIFVGEQSYVWHLASV